MAASVLPPLLRYQNGRTLAEAPAYWAGLPLRLPSGERVYLALSTSELALYFQDAWVAHYDWEGRLRKTVEPDCYLRRGLSHQVLQTRKSRRGLERRRLPESAGDELVWRAHARVAPVFGAWSAGKAEEEFADPAPEKATQRIAPLLERAAAFDLAAARQEAEEFSALYGRVPLLPPDAYEALVLQATRGCAYNGCRFCELYQGVPFRRHSAVEFRRHCSAAADFHGQGLRARRWIFLGDANALAQPQAALREIFAALHEQFEFPLGDRTAVPVRWWLGEARRFEGVVAFADAFSALRTREEWEELRWLGLRRVHVGLESGDPALLRWLQKPSSPESLRRHVAGMKAGGLEVGVIVLLGAGGRRFAESHARETVRLLRSLPLGGGDYVYFSPLDVQQDSRYADAAAAAAVEPLEEEGLRAQEAAIRSALRFDPERGRPYLARYELKLFVY